MSSEKKKIKIVTDSVADIPQDLLDKWNIDVIPCYVSYGGESYADDGKELDREKFYTSVSSMEEFPKTAAPPPAVAEEILRNALEGYDAIVTIHVADALSGTINNVRIASKSFPDGVVTVLDSETVSMGIGWQVIVAAEVAAETGSVEAVVKAVEGVRKNHKLYAAIYTMEFLRRSGRVSAVVASVGSFLKIKPIITILEKGEVVSAHRIRTFKKAKDKLAELLQEEGELERVAIIHTMNEEGARDFKETYSHLLPENTIISEVGPTLGTHIGIGSLGFISLKKGWQN